MAARKCKTQEKKNDGKIKSNNRRKRASIKKAGACEKPLNNLKWLGEMTSKGNSIRTCGAIPDWFTASPYNRRMSDKPSLGNSSVSDFQFQEQEQIQETQQPVEEEHEQEDRSVSTEASECNCSHSKYPEDKSDVLKTKSSMSNSLVSKYIKLGMNQVASFIVESAIRFGEEHGVVVPDKNTPNLYEVTPPDGKLAEKFRKIRFKTPKSSSETHKHDSNVSVWKNDKGDTDKRDSSSLMDSGNIRRSSSWASSPDSLDEILPILEKLKEGGDIVDSDLDLNKLQHPSGDEGSLERMRERDRDMDSYRERDRLDRERCRIDDRDKERLKKKWMKLKKRFKNELSTCEKEPYNIDERNRWKKFRRDSVELLRQRVKAATPCRRKQDDPQPSHHNF